jgi:hypothetical protein
MTLFRKPVSVKSALLLLLLPAGIGLLAIASLVHGLLLERMSKEFIESRLKDEVAFLEHHIRQAEGQIDALQTGDYFEEVFHHAFAIQSPTQTVISPQSWRPLLDPLLQSDEQASIRVHDAKISNAPSDILVYRKSFVVKDTPITVIVSEDMGALQNGQTELHAWTAIVSTMLFFCWWLLSGLASTCQCGPLSRSRPLLKDYRTAKYRGSTHRLRKNSGH